MIPYIIQQGDTLGQLAINNKTDIPTLQSLNSQITDPNKIIAGATLNLPDIKPTATAIGQNQAIVSSDLARNQFDKDLETLPKIEGQFQTAKPEIKTEGEEVKPAGAITFKSANPAFQSIIDQTNELISGLKTELSPEIKQRLNTINDFQTQKAMAVANAREAADEKDAAKLNESLEKAKEAETAQKSAMEVLRAELKTARESMITALTPTEKEIELRTKLNTLRTERQLLPLELRQEGITAAGIAGRQVEDERVRAIQESNLLAEIGLEQEARKIKELTYDKQAEYIFKDIELQQKIDDKLKEDAKEIIKNAKELKKDSLVSLSSILKSFEGLAWEDMDAETQAELIDTAKTQSISLNLLTAALKNAKQQRVFDNALKTKQEARLSKEKEKEKEVKLTPENKRDLAGAGYTPQDINDIERSVNDFGIKATLKAIDDENKRAIVAEKYNAQIILDEIENEIEEIKPKTAKWWQFWK